MLPELTEAILNRQSAMVALCEVTFLTGEPRRSVMAV